MSGAIAIGICAGPEQAAQIAPGYDYLELAVSATLMPLEDDAAYAPQGARLAALRPRVRAFNLFVPAELKLVGEGVDQARVARYVRAALRRARDLGAEIVVFGSGGARAVPDGYPRTRAWEQLANFLQLCADEAVDHGPTIAIEPLNRGECNILNSYAESVALAREVQRPEVRVLADIYHFVLEEEPLEHLLEAPEWLAHVHVADTGRRYPGSGRYPLPRLWAMLREIDYRGMASVECRWGDDYTDETARALAYLRALDG